MTDATRLDARGFSYYAFCSIVLASMLLVPIITFTMFAWDWLSERIGE